MKKSAWTGLALLGVMAFGQEGRAAAGPPEEKAPAEILAAPCSPTEVDLRAVKSAGNPVLNWTATAPWYVDKFQVLRQTSPVSLRQSTPHASVLGTLRTWTDSDLAAPPDLYYEIVPSASNVFTLEFAGPFLNLPTGDPELATDGFKPDPFLPYIGAPANVALSGDPAEFWVDVRSFQGCVPIVVELLLDRNDDGDFADAGEIIPMTRQVPGDPLSLDSLYFVRLDTPWAEAPATPPQPTSLLYARNENGVLRWAKADGSGSMRYQFRAWDGSSYASGPATAVQTLTLLNTAKELVEGLGIPLVVAGAGAETTDWQQALVYFEEAEERVHPAAPLSPFNQASPPERHPDYLNATLAAAIAETAYVFDHHKSLPDFEDGDANKRYRQVMNGWIGFANEQVRRMDHLATWAPSEGDLAGDPVWSFPFPMFNVYLEGGPTPLAFTRLAGVAAPSSASGLATFLSAGSLIQGLSAGIAPVEREIPAGLAPLANQPLYSFPSADWDRTDAFVLRSLFRSLRASARLYRLYEDPAAVRHVKVGDIDAIQTWLEPEADAKARAKCSPTPCPPLNHVDDDGDGLVDDLGYAARVFEEFDGVGIYHADGSVTLETVTTDLGAVVDDLRQAVRLVLLEADYQATNATLLYGDGGNHPPTFDDNWNYVDGSATPDGLPDLAFAPGDFFPAPWCPPAAPGDPEPPLLNTPLTIRNLGDDVQYWIRKAIEAYNKATSPDLDPACYPEGWVYTLAVCDWGYTFQKAVANTLPHYTINLRDDVEELLRRQGIDPADLGPDGEIILHALESIDLRAFIEAPESYRGYLPYFCPTHSAPVCNEALGYTFNGFWGDWDEPIDPIVPNKFWTIEPFAGFHQDPQGILLPPCVPANLNTDSSCIDSSSWDDANANGKYDLFERIHMIPGTSTPIHYIDLNGDGRWNGWTDQPHGKAAYAGEPTPGDGLYNGLYVYLQDPTFGGRLPGMTNESLNNFIGAAAAVASGPAEFPSNNHYPAGISLAEEPPTVPGANLRLRVSATDPDGDPLHYKLVLPSAWGGTVLVDGNATGVYELACPAGSWGFIGLAYDNVNNLGDLVGNYRVVSR